LDLGTLLCIVPSVNPSDRCKLKFAGLGIVEGDPHGDKPAIPTSQPSDPAQQAAWDILNQCALGALGVYVDSDLQHIFANIYIASDTWKALKDIYGKPHGVAGFVYFKELFHCIMSDGALLQPQMSQMLAMQNKIKDAGIEVSNQLITLMILSALPKLYKQLSSTILATNKDIPKLKPTDVSPETLKKEMTWTGKTSTGKISLASWTLTTKPLLKTCNKCGKKGHTMLQHPNDWELCNCN
jgi:hypothetical protein